jgi:hypothetical protein
MNVNACTDSVPERLLAGTSPTPLSTEANPPQWPGSSKGQTRADELTSLHDGPLSSVHSYHNHVARHGFRQCGTARGSCLDTISG